jgi:hypothetical protein
LTRYLEDTWAPVIEQDVDGARSLPLRIDNDNPNLGRYSATRRVARTLYLGSAPTARASNRGIEDRQIKLGCVQPGESAAVFGDALRRLTDQATFLYQNAQRYWYATQPSVNRLAKDRVDQLNDDDVTDELIQRLRREEKQRGDFTAVRAAPASGSNISDECEPRLVILGPNHTHTNKLTTSPARELAATLLESRGAGPRVYKNSLIFLAPDATRMTELKEATRAYLAWKSIETDREILDLDLFQSNQAKTKREQFHDTVTQRIPETYIWLIAPEQADARGAPAWNEIRLQNQGGTQESLAERVSRKLRLEELLFRQLAGTRLRMVLDSIPLWRGDHISTKQLAEDFAKYLYLPRLQNTDVLRAAIENGITQLLWETETFAYAEGWDAIRQRYIGLVSGRQARTLLDADSLVVHPDAARRQYDAEAAQVSASGRSSTDARSAEGNGYEQVDPASTTAQRIAETTNVAVAEAGKPVAPTRFYGALTVNDPNRLTSTAQVLSKEIIQHLTSLLGAQVRITLEIQATIPDGAPDHVTQIVTENCKTLKFDQAGFEEE